MYVYIYIYICNCVIKCMMDATCTYSKLLYLDHLALHQLIGRLLCERLRQQLTSLGYMMNGLLAFRHPGSHSLLVADLVLLENCLPKQPPADFGESDSWVFFLRSRKRNDLDFPTPSEALVTIAETIPFPHLSVHMSFCCYC